MIEHMDHIQKSTMFERFLAYKGYEFNLEPSTLVHGKLAYVVKGHLEGRGMFKCVCALQEVSYFAGEIRAQNINWKQADFPEELKEIIVSGGDLLTLSNIPKVLSYLETSLYQQFVLWRMEHVV